MKRLAILRPEPGASATLKRALGLGLDAFSLPLFEIAAVEWKAPDVSGFDGLLLTSANTVRFGGTALQALRGLPAYAVGEATAAEARAAGFGIAATGDEGVERLLGSIDPALRLLHLCGRHRTEVQAAQTITQLAVYGSRAIACVDIGALDGCVTLIHSPRAAQRLAELATKRSAIAIAAISPAATQAAGPGWGSISAADAPNDDALLALAARLCENGAR
ncbi:MAG: uroporphyrinogen-III synthase [Sphingomicrobium sp.]